MRRRPRHWGRGLIAACLGLGLVAGGCTSVDPVTESDETKKAALRAFVALATLCAAAIWAAGRTKNIASHSRWSVPALAAIVLTLVVPLALFATGTTMFFVSSTNPAFEVFLAYGPAILVCAAAIRCARAGLRQAQDQARGRAMALSAAVFAYGVGLLLAALGAFFLLLGLVGGSLN